MFGLFGAGNFGNEASLAAGIDAVRRAAPGATITTISTDPARAAALHGVPGVALVGAGPATRLASGPRWRRIAARPLVEAARWVTAVRHVRSVDVVLVPGTGVLDDFGMGPAQLPLDVFRWSVATRLARRPLAYLSIGAGPIRHPLSRRLMRWGLAQASFCSYRDEGSRRFMASLGRDVTNDELWPDLAFALDPPAPPAAPGGTAPVVAVGVMDYKGWRGAGEDAARVAADYATRLGELVRALRERGAAIRLVIGDDADRPTADALAAALADPGVTVCRSAAFEDVVAAVADAELLVASRYHNLVAALVAGVPAVSIGYAAKNEQLLASTGLGPFCDHIDTFSAPGVLVLVDRVLADRATLAAVVQERTDRLRAEVRAALAGCLQRLLAV